MKYTLSKFVNPDYRKMKRRNLKYENINLQTVIVIVFIYRISIFVDALLLLSIAYFRHLVNGNVLDLWSLYLIDTCGQSFITTVT